MAGVKPLAAPIDFPAGAERRGPAQGKKKNARRRSHRVFPSGVYTVKRCPPHTCEKRQNKKMSPSANVPRLRLVEQAMGIEPTTSAWEADVLPLNYACVLYIILLFHKFVK